MLRYLKIFSFLFIIIIISLVFLVAFFWNFYPGRRAAKGDFSENFEKIRPKSGLWHRFSRFSFFRLSLCTLRRSDADSYTVWSTWYYLTVKKRIFKIFLLVREICQFLCAGSRFFFLRAPKDIAGLCFHYGARLASFAFRKIIFLGRLRNTVLF